VYLTVYDSPTISTAARQKQAAAWLPRWTAPLEKVAADPRIGPAPGPATTHPTATAEQIRQQQELAALQQALGSGFSLIDGTVELEPGSALEGQLPDHGRYFATATLTHTDQADLQNLCGTDLSHCGTVALPDGTMGYTANSTQPWKDPARNAPTPEPSPTPGSAGIDLRTTVYEPQPDGQVVATTVELVSTAPLTAAEQADQTPADKAWLKALQTRLAQAAQDIGHLDTAGTAAAPTPTPRSN
jgi:hypothetical protein